MTPAVKSIETLESRIASIPAALEVAAKVELPPWAGAALRTVVTTGIGASEGPARVLASRLAQSGIAARFLPLAAFLTAKTPLGGLGSWIAMGIYLGLNAVMFARKFVGGEWKNTIV